MEEPNRRSYFRIDDQIGLRYQILDRAEYQQHQQEHRLLCVKEHQQHDLEHKISNGIRSIQIRNAEFGELLKLLNQKIDQLSRSNLPQHEHADDDQLEPRPVNISASGISFFQESPLSNNTTIEMHLTLYPDMRNITLFGQVVSCAEHHSAELERYKISVEFDYIVEEDRDELVHYIMRQQNLALRKSSGIDDDFE
jgi:hypothetical protein